jgi:cation:H+ antiporter
MTYIQTGPGWVAWGLLVLAFGVLAKSSDFFVDSAVGIASRLGIPKLVIGLVLVSFATTTPELTVSLLAARQGRPEMALGNAIGSIICNCGLALGLCGLLSRQPVPVMRRVFLNTAFCLTLACLLLIFFVWRDGCLARLEGLTLFGVFAFYLGFLFRQYMRGEMHENTITQTLGSVPSRGLIVLISGFLLGLGGVILSSRVVVTCAVTIAGRLGVPESIIALTIVALGTSVPEVATSVTSAIKGEGALSVGNILGANIMNVCWVAAASALTNPLYISQREMFLMFPALFIMLLVTIMALYTRETLSRLEGGILLGGYVSYVLSFFFI